MNEICSEMEVFLRNRWRLTFGVMREKGRPNTGWTGRLFTYIRFKASVTIMLTLIEYM